MKKEIIKHNHLDNGAKKSLKWRTIIGLILAGIVVPCFFLGGYFYLALVILFLGGATYEIAKAPSRKLSWAVWLITFVVMYALVFWVVIKSNQGNWKDFDINFSFQGLWVSPYALIVMIFLFFIIVVAKDSFGVGDAAYLISMTLLISLGFQALLFVRYIPFTLFKEKGFSGVDVQSWQFKYYHSSFLLYYLLIAICFNDMGAYFVGILFGKHKINPRISPKKTWEGFVGGIIISCACSMTFGLVCAHFNWPLIPEFNINGWYWILLCSLVLPIAGNLGDFTFSAIKRHFAVKDFSNILGPHGGILDRIDSAIFGALILAVLIIFITHGWDFYA